MFDRVFKHKEDVNAKPSYTELARRSRVARQKEYARRPKTAPTSSSNSIEFAVGHTLTHRHSLGDESMFPHHASPEPLRFSSPDALAPLSVIPPPAHPASLQPGRRPISASHVDNPCPLMAPERRASSTELCNPFRSDTTDSTTSMGRTESFDSFADVGVPVHRNVRSFRPAHTHAGAEHAPQKAAIFTTEAASASAQLQVPPSTSSAVSDPFTDSHGASQPASPSVSGASSPVPKDETMSPRHSSRRWSLLKSPRRASHDFLQVKIPTGVMSPVRESRLAFWSKA